MSHTPHPVTLIPYLALIHACDKICWTQIGSQRALFQHRAASQSDLMITTKYSCTLIGLYPHFRSRSFVLREATQMAFDDRVIGSLSRWIAAAEWKDQWMCTCGGWKSLMLERKVWKATSGLVSQTIIISLWPCLTRMNQFNLLKRLLIWIDVLTSWWSLYSLSLYQPWGYAI